jgi:hypothetical protein
MYEVFRCTDPWGREIVLMDDRWYAKILDDHPQLIGADWAVSVTLTDPQQLRNDKNQDNVEVFYREVVLPSPYGRSLLKVVVSFADDPDEGEVLSAYPVDNVSPLEVQIWP